MKTEFILEKLKKEGFYLVKDFLSSKDLYNIINEYDNIFKNIPDRRQSNLNPAGNILVTRTYKPGKHCRISPQSYRHIPHIVNTFNNNDMKKIVTEYCGPLNNFMMQIFMSFECHMCSKKEDWARNNWLHWDPYPALKFLLYLTDVTPGSAPTCIIPQTRSYGQKYRNKMSYSDLSGIDNGNPTRLEDWKEKPEFTNDDAIPIYASAGSLLIFDTDLLHYGGLIEKENKERKTILIHNRPHNLYMPVYD